MNENFGTYPITKEELEAKKKAYEEQQEKERVNGIEKFKILALPALIYAALSTFFLYKNFSGITMPLFAIATIVYVLYTVKKLNATDKCGWIFYAGGMIAFAISNVLTANGDMIFFNCVMIVILLVGMLMYLFFDQEDWTVGKYIGSFFWSGIGAIGCVGDFFSDLTNTIKESKNKRTRTGLYIVIGALLFIPIGIVIISLLMSADAVFSSMMKDVWDKIFSIDAIFLIPLFFLVFYIFAYGGLRFLDKRNIGEVKEANRGPVAVINTILSLISFIYLLFSGIQIFSLFLGKMTLPQDYTYAQYAREGFFQLLFVCLLNLVIVLIATGKFKEHISTKLLLMVICFCTFIMLASATMRLVLYVSVYNLTVLRLEVFLALAVIAIAMVFVMIYVFKKDFKLMHSFMFLGAIGFLMLSLSRPDAIVANYNLSHINEETDYSYLSWLSADAVPYIVNEEGQWAEDYMRYVYTCMEDKKGIRCFNFSRSKAVKMMEAAGYDYETLRQMEGDVTLTIERSDVGSIGIGTDMEGGGVQNANGEMLALGEEFQLEEMLNSYLPEDSDYVEFEINAYDSQGNLICKGDYYYSRGSVLRIVVGENGFYLK